MRFSFKDSFRSAILVMLFALPHGGGAADRPNILWIVVDDMSANLSCYGETSIETPHLDQLAEEGMKFTRAFVTAPVCSSSRSAMITGMYQTSIGAHHHRSGRDKHRIQLPGEVVPVPVLFQKAGYYTCIGSGVPGIDHRALPSKAPRLGKTDYNFDWDAAMYNGPDWSGRAEGQPFFMQVQLHGGKLRGDSDAAYDSLRKRAVKELGGATDPDKVELPPYYPGDAVIVKDWAAYLDSVRITDWHVGEVMARLEREGLLSNTLVIFMTDHGISHARGKQFLYDEGAHIPFIIRGPGVEDGSVRDDLVEHIDMAAISLGAAGLNVPGWMQGRDILAEDYAPREAIFAARDRCGEAADRIRSVRTPSYLYLRNFYPERPLLMPSDYKDSKAIIIRLREMHATGALPTLSEKLLFAPSRPSEELYAWTEDKWQTENLADDPAFAGVRESLSSQLDHWIESTGDLGDESPEVYDLEIYDELGTMDPDSDRYRNFSVNAEQYRQWAREGR